MELSVLNPEDSLHLADSLLKLSVKLFALAFCFKVGIVCCFSHFFLHFTFHFVKLAFGFVFRALLHKLSLLTIESRGVQLNSPGFRRRRPLLQPRESNPFGHPFPIPAASERAR